MIKLKLDENFSINAAEIFELAGFDTHTVLDENLSGEPDTGIYQACLDEKRCLITFDTDFCNILRFPHEPTEGIIVVRPKRPVSLSEIKIISQKIANLLQIHNPQNCLWVLDSEKLRVRKPRELE